MKLNSLDYSFDYLTEVEAYIIRLKGNKTSEEMADRCANSCEAVGQKYHLWDAFDGTSGEILIPTHAENQDHYRWLKLMNDKLTLTEIATILSHYSLWAHCVKIDLPIVIMEHDAIMVQKYEFHNHYNQIVYMGNLQQYQEGRYLTLPPHSTATKNYRFICRAHAYALDAPVARNLVSHLVKFGLTAPADMLIRTDIFPIIQDGFYAFDAPGETTITGRDPNWQKDAKEIISTFV